MGAVDCRRSEALPTARRRESSPGVSTRAAHAKGEARAARAGRHSHQPSHRQSGLSSSVPCASLACAHAAALVGCTTSQPGSGQSCGAEGGARRRGARRYVAMWRGGYRMAHEAARGVALRVLLLVADHVVPVTADGPLAVLLGARRDELVAAAAERCTHRRVSTREGVAQGEARGLDSRKALYQPSQRQRVLPSPS